MLAMLATGVITSTLTAVALRLKNLKDKRCKSDKPKDISIPDNYTHNDTKDNHMRRGNVKFPGYFSEKAEA